MDLLHQGLDRDQVLIIGLGLQQVAPPHEPDHIIEAATEDRHSTEWYVGILQNTSLTTVACLRSAVTTVRGVMISLAGHRREQEGVCDDTGFAAGQRSPLGTAFSQ